MTQQDRPATPSEKTRAFIQVARSGQLRVREIAELAGIDPLEAWEIVARGVKYGQMKVRDEDRTHQWIEVLTLLD